MAYEMIAGRAPFDAGHTKVIMDMHLYMKPRPLSEVVEGIDRNLSAMVDRMLLKDPGRRLDSARLIQSLIEMYLTNGRFPDLPKRA
jgi:serine/threonine protein kinase